MLPGHLKVADIERAGHSAVGQNRGVNWNLPAVTPDRSLRSPAPLPHLLDHFAAAVGGRSRHGRAQDRAHEKLHSRDYVTRKIFVARLCCPAGEHQLGRSEEHTSELQSLMRISYAVFFLQKKKNTSHNTKT